MSEALELMAEARAGTQALRDATRLWFDGMTAEDVSPSALEFARQEAKRSEREAARTEAHEQQMRKWLQHVHDPEAFWRLLVSSTREGDYPRVLGGNGVAAGQWWASLGEDSQAAVLDAAERYLRECGPHEETWYLQSKVDPRALAGRMAMDLLLESHRVLDPAICERWSFVLFADWPQVDRGERRDQLIRWAVQVAPRAVNTRAIEMTTHEIERGETVFVVRSFDGVKLDGLLDRLAVLLDKVTNSRSVIEPFGYWHQYRPQEAALFAEQRLARMEQPSELQVGLAASLVCAQTNECWQIAAGAFARSEVLFQRVVAAELPLGDRLRSSGETLSFASIAALWRVWLGRARVDGLPADGEVHTISPADGLGEAMTRALIERAPSDEATLDELAQLAKLDGAPAWMTFNVEGARVEHQHRKWNARSLELLVGAVMPVVRHAMEVFKGIERSIQTGAATGAAMKRLFTWVHLSDMHFGHGEKDPETKYDQLEVTRELPSHIKEVLKDVSLPIDAVLVTGDVAFSGQPKEYAQARSWFVQVCASAGISKENVFLVPGNHDVNAVGDGFVVGAYVEKLRRPDGSSAFTLARAWDDECAMLTLLSRQSAFWDFAKDYAPVQRQGTPFKGWWTYERVAADKRILIVGANTALLSAKRDKPGDIEFGQPQRSEVGTEVSSVTKEDVVLLLTHHPFVGGWLKDQSDLKSRLMARATVHLSGHVHQSSASATHDVAGLHTNHIEAGAVHMDEHETTHEYSICSLIERDGRRWLQQWPYRWAQSNVRFELNTSRLPPNGRAPAELDLGLC